ncbi:hypothetical protein [Lysinibacillus sp. FSL L8-0126]|uniref:hypothetical protein n=1 Tax=Lysinibacillus sp. FSL L8-0126 TaxID=2921515 RepID=UPI00315A9612
MKDIVYDNCQGCNNLASKKTLLKVGFCNNCIAQKAFEKYVLDLDYLKKKLVKFERSIYVLEFIDFLSKSDNSYIFKNRAVIDFIKIINGLNNLNNVSEVFVNDYFYRSSSIKSPSILEAIKVYFYSLEILNFDVPSENYSLKSIRPNTRYQKNILEYYFNTEYCSDCGKNISKLKSKNYYCFKCLGYRTLVNTISQEFINSNFLNEITRNLYKSYIAFLFKIGKDNIIMDKILKESIEFINFTSDYLPQIKAENDCDNDKGLKLIKNKNMYHFSLSNNWLEKFNEKFQSKFKKYFISYLEQEEILEVNNIDNETMKTKNRINKMLDRLPKELAKSIQAYFNKFELEKENYIKKNASKEVKWSTMESKIRHVFDLASWLVEKESMNSWSEVTEREINNFLIGFPEKNRTIKKRALYNFFEFCLKKRWLFANPIEDFTARDYKVTVKPLSKNEHAQIYSSILNLKFDYPFEVLVTVLVYFHSLTTRQILGIKMSHISLESNTIIIEGRPSIVMSNLEIKLLTHILLDREEKLGLRESEYLFCSYLTIEDRPINMTVISRSVKKITSMTPKNLRIASIQYAAINFGVEYLHQCLGLSLTQSNRYGDLDEYYLEDVIQSNIEREE